MAKSKAREWVSMECTECGLRNYRTPEKRGGQGKLELVKFCKICRKHVKHKEKKK